MTYAEIERNKSRFYTKIDTLTKLTNLAPEPSTWNDKEAKETLPDISWQEHKINNSNLNELKPNNIYSRQAHS